MSKTINRGWLKKQVEKGNIIVKCNYHYTDDYKFDNENNFGETGWAEAYLNEEWGHFEEGKMKFKSWDFKTKSGAAWQDEKGIITLMVHSNLSYDMKLKEAV